jgi:Protein of unknown function (DUF1800)
MRNRVAFALALTLAVAGYTGLEAAAKKKNAEEAKQFLKQVPDDQKILQALNRLTFGPRPGDAQDVKAMGLKKWIDRQLHPESIEENPVLVEKLKYLDTLPMSSAELVRNYPPRRSPGRWSTGDFPSPPIRSAGSSSPRW